MTRRIKNKGVMSRMNLRYKLFSGFILLIIIPLFLLGTITFFITFQLLEKKYSEQAEFSMRAMGHSIGYIFDEINKVTDSGIANNVFQQALYLPKDNVHHLVDIHKDTNLDSIEKSKLSGSTEGTNNEKESDYNNADYIRMIERQQNFRKLIYNHPSIGYAFLYNFRGYGESSIIPIFAKENFRAMPFEQFREHRVFEEVVNRKGEPLWLGPNEYPELTGYESVFTQIRVVKDLNTMKDLGISMVQMKNWDLDTFFNKFYSASQMDNTRFFIVNDDGLVFYDNEKKIAGSNISKYLSKPISLADGYSSYKDKFSDHESVISIYQMPKYNWHLVSVRDWNSISKEMVVYIKWVSVIMVICVLGAFLFNLLFMNRISKNIVRTVRFMRKVEDGDLSVRLDEEGNDELRLLSRGFNRLMDRVNSLIDQVKQEQGQKTSAEMRVLQAQIKPHFLFNTLESINVLAIQNEGRKVSQMVYRLGNILRISIQDKEEITVRQELEYLRSYLEIQKFRFEELFNFEIDVPEDLMNCMMQKLTLQPLVENCIQHAFDGITHTGWIRISAYADEERIYLTVEDNGMGMSNEQLIRFEYLQSEDTKSVTPQIEGTYNTERRGLGVRSVADRIRIQYGGRYGLYICSAPNCGTIIQCTIPRYEQGESQ